MPGYLVDADREPDESFEPGLLEHLVEGNRGRMLDARRTPVLVRAVHDEVAMFDLEVLAFEDAGAVWRLPLESVARFQFRIGSRRALPRTIEELSSAIARLNRPLVIEIDPARRRCTTSHLRESETQARQWLNRCQPSNIYGSLNLDSNVGDSRLYAALQAFLGEQGLANMDEALATQYVSNPAAGETVKCHAIVLAELGLAPYQGTAVRDPAAWANGWSRKKRSAHILARLGFVRALFRPVTGDQIRVYRGASFEEEKPDRPAATLVSATLDRAIAEAHFEGGPTSRAGMLLCERIPVELLFMTYHETEALNRVYEESEAVLLGHPPGILLP